MTSITYPELKQTNKKPSTRGGGVPIATAWVAHALKRLWSPTISITKLLSRPTVSAGWHRRRPPGRRGQGRDSHASRNVTALHRDESSSALFQTAFVRRHTFLTLNTNDLICKRRTHDVEDLINLSGYKSKNNNNMVTFHWRRRCLYCRKRATQHTGGFFL